MEPSAERSSSPRAHALDALRGLAIMGMCLSGVVPWRGLPNWMYHAQFPRYMNGEVVQDIHFIDTWAGYSWVDLVFPAFLFSMGAAFPFALSARLKRSPIWRVALGAILRGLLLVAFAIYVEQISPYAISPEPTTSIWFLSILGFALLFPIYTRIPKTWKPGLQWGIRGAGILGALALLVYLNPPNGLSAAQIHEMALRIVTKSDIIILILASAAAAGSLVWLATRNNIPARVGVMIFSLLVFLSVFKEFHFIHFLRETPAGWLYIPPWGFLLVVIPGTIAGDLMLKWLSDRAQQGTSNESDSRLLLWVSGAVTIVVIAVHAGLQARQAGYTIFAVAAAAVGIALALRSVRTSGGQLVRALFAWGTVWLLIGILMDTGALDPICKSIGMTFLPSQGGIKKDPVTVSYLLVSPGLATYLLLCFITWIEILGRRKPFGLLVATGQNPMLAYVGIRTPLAPIVNLTGLDALMYNKILAGPWLGTIWATIKTVALAVMVSVFTRLKIIWRT